MRPRGNCRKSPTPCLSPSAAEPSIFSIMASTSLAFPLFPSQMHLALFSPSQVCFVCFGIRHKENQTSPTQPARLVPEPAGASVEIGQLSGWPLLHHHHRAGHRMPTLRSLLSLAFLPALSFGSRMIPHSPSWCLFLSRMPVYPLSQQQPWEIH